MKHIFRILGVVVLTFVLSCISAKKTEKSPLKVFKPQITRKVASIAKQMESYDPRKKTVCTVTINSSDEKEVFQKYLGKDFNFVELTDIGDNESTGFSSDSDDQWLNKACEAKLTCDVLVVSGHFGGAFFGSSGFKLSMEGLEQHSCSKKCGSVLEHPKEVFLFGCNTLAGKSKDSRTEEEYAQVLERDGFTPLEAQQAAAFRYSDIGFTFHDRMARVFPKAMKLYGFDSVGPSGENVRSMLEKYFQLIPNYSSHLDKLTKTTFNKAWDKALGENPKTGDKKLTTQTQSAGIESKQTDSICMIHDNNVPNYKKLFWIERRMSSEKALLESMPTIEIYVNKFIKKDNYPDSAPVEVPHVQPDGVLAFEGRLRESMRRNLLAKQVFGKYLAMNNIGLLRPQIAMLNIGSFLGWISAKEYSQIQRRLIGDLRKPIDRIRAEFICSQNIRLPELRLEDLPSGKWAENDFGAVSCLAPQDIRVARKLAQYAMSGSGEFAILAVMGMNEIKLYEPELTRKLVNFAKNLSPTNDILFAISEYLSKAPPSSDLFDYLIETAQQKSDYSFHFQMNSANYFLRNRIVNEKVAIFMAQLWKENQGISPLAKRYFLEVQPCSFQHILENVETEMAQQARTWNKASLEIMEDGYSAEIAGGYSFNDIRIYPQLKTLCSKQ